jgi:hypothetical protein
MQRWVIDTDVLVAPRRSRNGASSALFKDRAKTARHEDFLAFLDGAQSEKPVDGDML